jgi:two-component system, NarL family, sensor histidine kinase YdfH
MEAMNRRRLTSIFSSTAGTELPFFLFLTVILLGIYGLTVAGALAVREPVRLIPLTVLMLAHLGLYWTTAVFEVSRRRTLLYLALQGALAFSLALIGRNLAMVFGLFLGLIGITAGLLKLTRLGIAVIGGYAALSLAAYGLINGWATASWWLVGIVPSTAFVTIYVTLYNRQTAARARAQALAAELEAANLRLAEYSARVEELTLAAERQRMARELHDTLSQGLAGLILQLEAADAHLEEGRAERARTIVQQTMERARGALAEARRVIDDLRRAGPAPTDAVAALRQEIERFSEATGIPCSLEIAGSQPLPPSLAGALAGPLYEALLRTVTEGLSNIARHARASQASLRLSVSDGWLEAALCDDGAGFDPQANQAGHYGLLGMQERARLAGGTVEIDTHPGSGTTITLRLPLNKGV